MIEVGFSGFHSLLTEGKVSQTDLEIPPSPMNRKSLVLLDKVNELLLHIIINGTVSCEGYTAICMTRH